MCVSLIACFTLIISRIIQKLASPCARPPTLNTQPDPFNGKSVLNNKTVQLSAPSECVLAAALGHLANAPKYPSKGNILFTDV